MNNNERFNAMLNGCCHPRAVYAALWALGEREGMDKLLRQYRKAGQKAKESSELS